jgi:predicted amidohydrolase YtcJ
MEEVRKVLLKNGRIYTGNPLRPRVSWVLISGNRIVAVGNDRSAKLMGPTPDQEIDLEGATVVPGFTDGHIHLQYFAEKMEQIDLASARSEEGAVEILKGDAKSSSQVWVRGYGWSHNQWDRPALPTRASLDRAFPDVPVALSSKCGHLLWVNSAALRKCEITKSTPAPSGGKIALDPETKELSGILKETAIGLVLGRIGQPSVGVQKEMLERAFRMANEVGVTSIHNMEDLDSFQAFQELAREGRLRVRVTFYLPLKNLDELIRLRLQSGFGNEWLRIGGIKLFADGSLGGRTALMLEPFEREPENSGVCVMSQKELEDVVARANRHSIAVGVHAIGDRAVRETLRAFRAAVGGGVGSAGAVMRNRIEHFQLIHPDDLALVRGLDVIAAVQPVHLCSDMSAADTFWGRRARYAYAFKSLQDAGALLVFGSDAPVEPMNPLYGLYAAVTRKNLEGKPEGGWYGQERLGRDEALAAYTRHPAMAVGESNTRGTLEPGKLADVVVLSADPFSVPEDALKEIRVRATVVNGECVYGTLGES